MNLSDILRQFTYPARNLTVMLSALFIFLLLEFAAFGSLMGLFLAMLILPSLFHYLMRLLDARAKGKEPGPLEVEDLMWFQGAWSLFMIFHLAVVVYAIYIFGSLYKLAGLLISATLLAAVIPATDRTVRWCLRHSGAAAEIDSRGLVCVSLAQRLCWVA